MVTRKGLFIASIIISLVIISFYFLLISRLEINFFANEINLEITPLSTEFVESINGIDQTEPGESTPIPGVFSIGYKVRIINTEGDGLRIRLEPGFDGSPMFLGAEGEEFEILQGPTIEDNTVWWFIEGIANSSRKGWAAQDYLRIIN